MLQRETDKLVISSMQWALVADIDDVHKLDDTDAECLREIRAILARHKKLERFGVTLVHSHFHIDDDEILVETVERETRTLTVRPIKRTEAGKTVETAWSLAENEPLIVCRQHCIIEPPGHR
jgi:hypothetical protein